MIRYLHFIVRITIYVQKLILDLVSPPMFFRSGLFLLEGYFIKGPSKNYVMLRGGRGSTNLLYIVTYIIRGTRGYFVKYFT